MTLWRFRLKSNIGSSGFTQGALMLDGIRTARLMVSSEFLVNVRLRYKD